LPVDAAAGPSLRYLFDAEMGTEMTEAHHELADAVSERAVTA